MIKLKDLLNEVKFKSPDYIISTTPASSLPAQKLGYADVSVGLKMAEKLKNYTLHVRHYKLVHADGKVALKLTPEGKTAVRVRTEDDPKYLQLIQNTVNDVVADFVSKLKESVNEALDPKAEKFLDAIQVNDRSIKDLKNITVDATPQGNWSVYYKGKRMFTLNGKMLDDKTIMKYGLEHMDESLSEGKKIQRPVNRWLELKNDESMHANKKLATGLRELKYQFKESVNEAQAKYDVYHNSYTSAIQSAREYAEKQGYEINDDDAFRQIGMGPKKPSEGKTNRFSIELSKDGKVQRKRLQIQVYGMKNRYELNTYIN
jgi:hypothetical protein